LDRHLWELNDAINTGDVFVAVTERSGDLTVIFYMFQLHCHMNIRMVFVVALDRILERVELQEILEGDNPDQSIQHDIHTQSSIMCACKIPQA
jgi:hypothetical protein